MMKYEKCRGCGSYLNKCSEETQERGFCGGCDGFSSLYIKIEELEESVKNLKVDAGKVWEALCEDPDMPTVPNKGMLERALRKAGY